MSTCQQLVTGSFSGELSSFDQYRVCAPYLVADAFVQDLCEGHINLKYNIVTFVPLWTLPSP